MSARRCDALSRIPYPLAQERLEGLHPLADKPVGVPHHDDGSRGGLAGQTAVHPLITGIDLSGHLRDHRDAMAQGHQFLDRGQLADLFNGKELHRLALAKTRNVL